MPKKNGPTPEELKLMDEAADIFQRLDDDPDDAEARKARDAFLARGEAERLVYERLLKAVRTAKFALKPKPKRPPSTIIILAALLGTLLYAAYQPVSVYLQADAITGRHIETITLTSGDSATLDASSALIDRTDSGVRTVELLKGAAYFDVDRNARPFLVEIDDVEVEVTGTEFEVTRFGDEVQIAVAEGSVEVRFGQQSWRLGEGDRLRLTDDRESLQDTRLVADIGTWRQDLIIADRMTFADVVDIIERRIPGPVFIIGDDLSKRRFTGRLNLGDPAGALNALATISGSRVRSASPVATIVSDF